MNSNPVHESVGQPEKPYSIGLHCLVLTLIGGAAIGVGLFLLPPADMPQALTARGAGPVAGSHASAVDNTPAVASDAAEKPFDYFPAQFPTPRGDADEQPATF